MRCTIKLIVKFGLIAEIITAIIGSIGEYWIRYQIYTMAMDELFGVWNERTPEMIARIYAHHHHHTEWPSNHIHYDHQTGESFSLSQLNQLAASNDNDHMQHSQTMNSTFLSKLLHKLSTWLLTHNGQSKMTNDSIENDTFDPRPLLVLLILIIFNLIFIFAVIFESMTIMGLMALSWILYLILLFVVVRVMNDSLNKSMTDYLNGYLSFSNTSLMTPSSSSTSTSSTQQLSWSSLLPSPFIILVVIIILLFTFILMALITEQRRQIATRIRARSACIPLVKSRDMDLDDI